LRCRKPERYWHDGGSKKRKGSVSLGKVDQMFGSLAAVEQEDTGATI
jgi:hypothetical protein